jgi:hypothetical protein
VAVRDSHHLGIRHCPGLLLIKIALSKLITVPCFEIARTYTKVGSISDSLCFVNCRY